VALKRAELALRKLDSSKGQVHGEDLRKANQERDQAQAALRSAENSHEEQLSSFREQLTNAKKALRKSQAAPPQLVSDPGGIIAEIDELRMTNRQLEEQLTANRRETMLLSEEALETRELLTIAENHVMIERESVRRLENALRVVGGGGGVSGGGASLSPSDERKLTHVVERLQAEVIAVHC